ncbi:MAG: prepilin-type N-terminal cleavage/methylation domain-containing protein [Phycisphaerae bacterium]
MRRGFSLLELMVGIVVLGLGMVMVATMFPVAWHRARELNDYTIERTASSGAHDTLKSLLRVAGPFEPSSFAGDFILDPVNREDVQSMACALLGGGIQEEPRCADGNVHVLNLQNLLASNREELVDDEGHWDLEDGPDPDGVLNLEPTNGQFQVPDDDYLQASYMRAQLSISQRLYPPLPPFDPLSDWDQGEKEQEKQHWYEMLDSTRFCWAVLHRLLPIRPECGSGGGFCWEKQEDKKRPAFPLCGRRCPRPADQTQFDNEHVAEFPRTFKMYYVTLRRAQPTYRFARQDPTSVPDPFHLDGTVVTPAPLEPEDDLMFPVPWRVQVQFPDYDGNGPPPLKLEDYEDHVATVDPQYAPTWAPTEITVPPEGVQGVAVRTMILQMFPRGAWFVDELTGKVFRVTKRRIVGNNADTAVLTLDREVYLEELDLDEVGLQDPRCIGSACKPLDPSKNLMELGPGELLRTVWVYPPAVKAQRLTVSGRDVLVFEGSQPVVGISKERLTLSPADQ